MLAIGASALALALVAQPPPPVEVGRVGLGSELGSLVTGPDGGAWVRIDRFTAALDRGVNAHDDAIGRATPDNRFRITAVDGMLSLRRATLGPDGQAWFLGGLSIDRSDAAGNVTRSEFEESLGDVVATGPDGTLWAVEGRTRTLSRVDAQGAVTRSRLALPACKPFVLLQDMQAATDGAIWIADPGCNRLIRIASGGTPRAIALDRDDRPFVLAPDRSGGMWFTGNAYPEGVAHVDAAGTIRRWRTPTRYGNATDIAVGPDGTAYLAFGRCRLGRLAPGKALAFGAAPIPVRELAFDPSGGMWLASTARLVHASTTNLSRGTCDDKPPALKLSPALRGPVRLAQLRRGVRITVREPATISASADYGNDDHDSRLRIVRTKTGGTLTFRLPRGQLRLYERELDAGRKPELSLYVEAYDRDGNAAWAEQEALPVTR